MAIGHAFDGLVLIPNCDKIVPGMLMAAARLNIPAVVVSGGPMLPGRRNGVDISVSTAFEAAGRFEAHHCLIQCPYGRDYSRLRITSYNVCYTKLLRNGSMPSLLTGLLRPGPAELSIS